MTSLNYFHLIISYNIKVNGERSPTEVYNDFRSSILQILSAYKAPVPVTVPNGNAHVLKIDAQNPKDETENQVFEDPQTSNQNAQPKTFPRVIWVVGK